MDRRVKPYKTIRLRNSGSDAWASSAMAAMSLGRRTESWTVRVSHLDTARPTVGCGKVQLFTGSER